MKRLLVAGGAALMMLLAGLDAHAQQPDRPLLTQRPAARVQAPAHARILAATRAGKRIVAVGDRGVVLLSDDDGRSYRQARTVPTRAALTSVSFVDEREGWAVGHWGVILHTGDGGQTWNLQRDDLTVDQPLFTVWFKDRNEGMAAGLFSLLLKTSDGGKSWSTVTLPAPGARRSDVNLFRIFPDRQGHVLIAGEQGLVFIGGIGGGSWEVAQTGNKGTFWSGLTLDDGSILVAGLRGKIYRSADQGKSWEMVDSGTKSSITDLAQTPDGRVFGTALDGVMLVSLDRGLSFKVHQRADQHALTALAISAGGVPVLFSDNGIVKQ